MRSKSSVKSGGGIERILSAGEDRSFTLAKNHREVLARIGFFPSVLDSVVSTLFDFVWFDPTLREDRKDRVIGKRVKIPRGPRHCDRGRPGQQNH